VTPARIIQLTQLSIGMALFLGAALIKLTSGRTSYDLLYAASALMLGSIFMALVIA
jgi:hypothetical protein